MPRLESSPDRHGGAAGAGSVEFRGSAYLVPMATALVTGATAGIGREFATQLAARGQDLVLVARNVDRLEGLAAELRSARGVRVEVRSADLSDRPELESVAARLADPADPIDLLVNNAGFGMRERFLDNEIAAEEASIDVMVRAVVVLSHAAGRSMRDRGRGAIVNVSSVAGFLPSGTYSAAKAFVTNFSESLAGELAGSGVTVTALCPGFTHTEFHERMGSSMSSVPPWLWLDAPKLVSACLGDVARGRVVSVPGAQYKAIVGLLRFAPRSLLRHRARGAHRPAD